MVGTGAMKEEDVAVDGKMEKENAHAAKRPSGNRPKKNWRR
jgi:hypothetical protein